MVRIENPLSAMPEAFVQAILKREELVGTPAEVRAIEAAYRCGRWQAQLERDGLTHDELVIACKSIGYDLTCAACAAVFYTGVGLPHDSHTCARTGPPA